MNGDWNTSVPSHIVAWICSNHTSKEPPVEQIGISTSIVGKVPMRELLHGKFPIQIYALGAQSITNNLLHCDVSMAKRSDHSLNDF